MMRVLLPLLLVAVVVTVVVLSMMARNRLTAGDERSAVEAVPWRAAHVSRDGVTHVVVRRGAEGQVIDERAVTTVADDDPDFDAKFLEAMVAARARADLFNAGES